MRIRRDKLQFNEEAEIIAKVSDAFAHPLRVELFKYIYKENMQRRQPCTKDLVEKFTYSQSTISQHMSKLTISGLIEVQKKNSFSYYYVNIGILGKYLDAVKKINQ
ncbi:MAG: helix-turn-helix domain-containing protein [Clostridia bacterium]|nr:helix-turn-helix domain-containing protein [Clostridia bacterium]